MLIVLTDVACVGLPCFATVGHPFDTIKTKMQAQSGYLEGGGTLSALTKVWRAEGMKGLYRQEYTDTPHRSMQCACKHVHMRIQ